MYVIVRSARKGVSVRAEHPEAGVRTLLETRPTRRVDWTAVARSVLADALAEPPVRKLALDYGRFLFTPRGETLRVSGPDVERWIGSWTLPTFPGERPRAAR